MLSEETTSQINGDDEPHSNSTLNTNNNNSNSIDLKNRITCKKCELHYNSIESLQVHMQYQHEDMSRWSVPTSVQPTPASSTLPINTTSSSSSSGNKNPNSTNNNSNNNNNSGGGGSVGGANLNNNTISNPSASPTDSENNNNNINNQQQQSNNKPQYNLQTNKTENSPLNNNNNNNNTVSAAADSSDNQPPTPQPSNQIVSSGTSGGSNNGGGSIGQHNLINDTITPPNYINTANSPYHHPHHPHHPHHQQGNLIMPQEMHSYPTYVHGYDQFYHPPPGSMDYAQSSIYGGGQQGPPPSSHHHHHPEYKLVPSSRYHPYLTNHSSLHPQAQQQQQQQTSSHNTNNSNSNTNTSSTVSNSSLSPRVVSSSSPTQNAIIGQTAGGQQETGSISQGGQPTPSPSPKQCDKCGLVCQTHIQLSEHYAQVHGVQSGDIINRSGSTTTEENDMQNQYSSYQISYIKEEPTSDILDLDSQKMVYPPQHETINQEPLPPMHSMHPMHRPLMWGGDMHAGYMSHSQPDIKSYQYSPIKQAYPSIKQEYPSIKSEYVSLKQDYSGVPKTDYPTAPGFTSQMIKSEFNAHHQQISAQTRTDMNKFATDMTTGGNNPVSSSPSEFPSTTTPQDNGGQFRGFEPPTSSLPNNPGTTKSATWKSNEARRPKTYNCTACNKWFTSSGHLKRHYNTTLHKNAVKSSGQPDPATMPISAHHHPSRDPNSKHHHRNTQSQQPPPAPPEPPRSPEYTPQYTPPPTGFTQPPQGFQQYSNTLHSAANGHPNGLAGPSVHASQPRGLLILSNMEATSSLAQEETVHLQQHQQHQQEEHYNQILELQQLSNQLPLQSQQHNTNTSLEQEQMHIISMSPHQQSHQHLQQQQQQQQQQDITLSTMPITTTTINSMDPQQRYIINPTATNTITNSIIPSFQHLQLQENYHTIIDDNSNSRWSTATTPPAAPSGTDYNNYSRRSNCGTTSILGRRNYIPRRYSTSLLTRCT